MDWRFASWAMQENIKLSSIDSALKIPGVSTLSVDWVKLTRLLVSTDARTIIPQLSGSLTASRLAPRESGVAGTMAHVQGPAKREASPTVPRYHTSYSRTTRKPGARRQDRLSTSQDIQRCVQNRAHLQRDVDRAMVACRSGE